MVKLRRRGHLQSNAFGKRKRSDLLHKEKGGLETDREAFNWRNRPCLKHLLHCISTLLPSAGIVHRPWYTFEELSQQDKEAHKTPSLSELHTPLPGNTLPVILKQTTMSWE